MKSNTIRSNDNITIPADWRFAALRTVRDSLQTLEPDRLLAMRDTLAVTLGEAIGGLCVPARTLDDQGPDFEDTDASLDEILDRLGPGDDEPTPLDLLAAGVPVSGGAPERFVPSEADWDEYFACRHDDGPLDECDVIRSTGCC